MYDNIDWVLSGFSCNCVVMLADSGMLDQDIVGGCLGQGASAEQLRLTVVFSITYCCSLGLSTGSCGESKEIVVVRHLDINDASL